MKKLPIKLSFILGITVALLAVVFWVGLMVDTSPVYADDGSAPAEETAPADEAAPADETTSGDEVAPVEQTDQATEQNQTEGNSFTATITPTTATAGETQSYTLTITNVTGGQDLGSARIDVPPEFESGLTLGTVSTRPGSGDDWTASYTGGYIYLRANTGGDKLDSDWVGYWRNDWVSVTFTATAPATPGTYEFTTQAWTSLNWTGSQDSLARGTSQPQVTVTAPTPPTITGVYSSDALGNPKDSFLTTEDVYATITTSGGSPGGSTNVNIYVVNDGAYWGLLSDQSGGYENVTVPTGGGTYLIWSANTTAGDYDIVVDANQNGWWDWWREPVDTFEWWWCPFVPGFTVTAPPQYYLTVTSPYGTTGGEGWYDEGDIANATVTPLIVPGPAGTQYVFTGWTGDASGTTSPSDPITMDGPKTATATWKTQCYLTVDSPYGLPTSGEGWYDEGDTAYAGLTSGIESGGTGTQYVFVGWTDDASGTDYSQSDPITMNDPKTATADWKTRYYLTVTSPYSTTGGYGWYDDGDTAYATVDPLTVPGYIFTNWSGDASGNTSPSEGITMNYPKTAIAVWTSAPAPLGGGFERVLVINWFGVVRAYLVNAAGILLQNVYITSPDGNATLVIPAGTLVLDADGLPLYLHPNPDIIAGMTGTPPAPPGTTIAAVYEFLPSGVTFKWKDAQLIVKYDPAMVAPGGVVVIAYYDEATGRWVELETAGYVVGGEEVPNTVISSFSHSTYFALLIKSPAE